MRSLADRRGDGDQARRCRQIPHECCRRVQLHHDLWRLLWLTGGMSTYTDTLGLAMADSDVVKRVNLSMLECLANGGDSSSWGKDEGSAVAWLARALDYDHALIRLSVIMGFETGPDKFEMPEPERDRLRHALAGLGPVWEEFMLRNAESKRLVARKTVRPRATRSGCVPVSDRKAPIGHDAHPARDLSSTRTNAPVISRSSSAAFGTSSTAPINVTGVRFCRPSGVRGTQK